MQQGEGQQAGPGGAGPGAGISGSDRPRQQSSPSAAFPVRSDASLRFLEAELGFLLAGSPAAAPRQLLPAPDAVHSPLPISQAFVSTAESGGATEQDVAARRLAHLQQLQKLYKIESWGLMEELRSEQCMIRREAVIFAGQQVVLGEESAAARGALSVRSCHRRRAQPLGGAATTGGAEHLKSGIPSVAPLSRPHGDAGGQRLIAPGAVQAEQCPPAGQSPPEQPSQQKEAPLAGITSSGGSPSAAAEAEAVLTADLVVDDSFVCSAAKNTAVALGDEVRGYGSEEEPATFSEVKREILEQGVREGPVQSPATLECWYREFQGRLEDVGRLEASASAASGRDMTREHALAQLAGRRNRYLIKRPLIMIGRGHARGGDKVDVDLSEEGDAKGVSRQQAKLELKRDGCFYLRNLGGKPVFVNDVAILKGHCIWVPHLSLVQVSGISLLFMVNQEAIRRILLRSEKLATGFV